MRVLRVAFVTLPVATGWGGCAEQILSSSKEASSSGATSYVVAAAGSEAAGEVLNLIHTYHFNESVIKTR